MHILLKAKSERADEEDGDEGRSSFRSLILSVLYFIRFQHEIVSFIFDYCQIMQSNKCSILVSSSSGLIFVHQYIKLRFIDC